MIILETNQGTTTLNFSINTGEKLFLHANGDYLVGLSVNSQISLRLNGETVDFLINNGQGTNANHRQNFNLMYASSSLPIGDYTATLTAENSGTGISETSFVAEKISSTEASSSMNYINGFSYGEALIAFFLLLILIHLFFSSLKEYIFGVKLENPPKYKYDKDI
jgi:hypothetical protein